MGYWVKEYFVVEVILRFNVTTVVNAANITNTLPIIQGNIIKTIKTGISIV